MNKQSLTIGSLFDGSGGFPLGAVSFGIEPLWASEVEPFAIRVTTKRLPNVRHLGDINKIDGSKIPPVDIITAGFPCTDVSCAGRRAGLHAERTGLFFQAIRVIREMLEATDGEYPKFLCFENVPGLLSSNKGADFCEVMDEITALGFISDPNIIDAADFGVAQRRRRVYIASINRKFYDAAVFADAPKVRDKRMEKALALWGGETFYGVASRPYTPVKQRLTEILQSDVDVKYYLSVAACLGILRRAEARGKKLPELLRRALESQAGLMPHESGDGDVPLVFEPGATSRLGAHHWKDGTPIGTLRAQMGDNQTAVAIPINTQVATRHKALGEATGFGVGEDGDPAYTIQAGHSHAVALENHPNDSRLKVREDGTVQTLSGRMGTGGNNVPLVMNERQYAMTVGEDVANCLTESDYKGTQCLFEPVTMKIRAGKPGGGKGVLCQQDKSATLSCNNAQTVFVPKLKTYDVRQTSDGTTNARCRAYDSEVSRAVDRSGNVPGSNHGGIAVVDELASKAAAFMGGQGSDAGSIAYNEETAPTLKGQAGGNTVPMVMTAYGICSQSSNSMRSQNPDSGIYEAETAKTLDSGCARPDCHQGGVAVVFDGKQVTSKQNRSNPQPDSPCHTLASGSADSAVLCVQGNVIGRKPENGPQGSGVNDNVSFSLTGVDRHAVAYQDVIGTLAASDHKFPQQQQINEGKAIVERITIENYQHNGYRECDTAGTLKQCGGTNGGGSESMVIENRYVVRRLTPTECALLQGFPPDWCDGLETPEPTEEDIAFWSEVWETHRKIMGKSKTPKSRNQIIKFLKKPHSDSKEYALWGNGVALPCVKFVLGGIAEYAGK